jgi:hypothetical protein
MYRKSVTFKKAYGKFGISDSGSTRTLRSTHLMLNTVIACIIHKRAMMMLVHLKILTS